MRQGDRITKCSLSPRSKNRKRTLVIEFETPQGSTNFLKLKGNNALEKLNLHFLVNSEITHCLREVFTDDLHIGFRKGMQTSDWILHNWTGSVTVNK